MTTMPPSPPEQAMLQTLPSTTSERLEELRLSGTIRASDETLLLLAGAMQRVAVPAGGIVFAEGQAHCAFMVLLSGTLEAVEIDKTGATRLVRVIAAGEAVDELQVLAGRDRGVVVRAASDVEALHISTATLNGLSRDHQELREMRERVRLRQLLCRLSPVFGAFDQALLAMVEEMGEWCPLARGALTPAFAGGVLHLVISGRVQAIESGADGVPRTIEEAGRGDALGERSLFREHAAPVQLRAVRDSLMVAFSSGQIEALIARKPSILRNVLQLFATPERPRSMSIGVPTGCITNVALIPTSDDVSIGDLARRLASAMGGFGKVLHLTSDTVDASNGVEGLAQSGPGSLAEAELLTWLDLQEGMHRFVLFQADATDTPWTRRCLGLADRVLLVAQASGDPAPGMLEQALFAGQDPTAHETLVLLHPDGAKPPRGTRAWRTARPMFEDHVHVRQDRNGDIERLARLLAGRAVGLVLGGGGARGFAHIGVLRALEEAGIPVDAIGGTSMGASLAAQYAMGLDPQRMVELNDRVWVQLRPHTKYTLPILSLVGNTKSTLCGQLMYGDMDIEDCWLPFFCVSSNLTTAEMRVHREGSLLWAATASASIPAFAVPVTDGYNLLVDGGLLNNVPADVMRELGCGTVLAVEVSPESDDTFVADRVPSPWEVLRRRVSPAKQRAKQKRFPSLLEVAMRATMLHSVQRERVAMADADLCLHPPIDAYSLMDFGRLHQIVETGYAYARDTLRDWRPAASPH